MKSEACGKSAIDVLRAATRKKRKAGQDFWPALTANPKLIVPQGAPAGYASLIHKVDPRGRGIGVVIDEGRLRRRNNIEDRLTRCGCYGNGATRRDQA